jgi:hypothetical protein
MPRLSDAYLRTGSQVFLWDKGAHPLATGEERRISAREELAKQRLELPGRKPARAAYPNAILRDRVPVTSTAASRLYTVATKRGLEDATTLRLLRSATPGLAPVDVTTRAVTERGIAQFGSVFPGRCLNRAYLPDTTSGLRLFDVLYLHDAKRADAGRKARVFAGRQRLGIDPHRAELTIAVRNRKPRRANFARGAAGSFPRVSDQSAFETIKRAVVSSKAWRDKILIDTSTTRNQRFSDGIPLNGSRKFSGRVSAVF